MIDRLRQVFLGPFRELIGGLDRVLHRGVRSLLWVALGLVLGWWVYVPLHELLHALGCRLAGGSVSRLEIDPLYGGGLLARLFPFVQPGGAYAGRLSGFDTRGSDWIYLATDLAPFLLAWVPGFWGLRRAARAVRPMLFGGALPFALAPLLSLTGDAYEIGSLAVVHLPLWQAERILIGDDLGAKFAEIVATSNPLWIAGAALSTLLGSLWAFAWLSVGRGLASRLGEAAIEDLERAPRSASS